MANEMMLEPGDVNEAEFPAGAIAQAEPNPMPNQYTQGGMPTPDALEQLRNAGVGITDDQIALASNVVPASGGQPQITPAIATNTGAPQLGGVSLPLDAEMMMSSSAEKKAPESIDKIRNAYNIQQTASDMEFQAKSQQADQQAKLYEQQAINQQKLADSNMVRQQKIESDIDEKGRNIDAAIKDLNEQKIDPERYWNNASTGQKILAGLSMAFGAFGTRPDGKNPGAVAVFDAIDRDIDLQKAAIARKGSNVELMKGSMGNLYKKLGNVQDAYAATRVAALDKASLQLQGLLAKTNNPIYQAQGMKVMGDIEKEKQTTIGTMQANVAAQQARARLLGGGQSQASQDLSMLPPEEAEKYQARSVSGSGFNGVAKTSERAKVLQESVNDASSAATSIDEMLKLGKTSGREFLPTAAKAQAKVLGQMLQGNLRTFLVGPGAVSEGERKLIQEIIANPTDITQYNAAEKLETLKKVIDRNLRVKLKNEGINVPASVEYGKAQ